MNAIQVLKKDIEQYGVSLNDTDYAEIQKVSFECAFPMGDVILSRVRVEDHWLFLTRGIVASEQSTLGGDALIARFFEAGHLCANLTSAWARELDTDDLIAITNVEGVLLPHNLFREQYLRGNGFGEYLRLKTMETLMFDKDILCAKTSNNTEVRYGFLEHNYKEVVRRASQKDLARFVGVTPQGLNRFLKNRDNAQSIDR